MKSMKKQRGMIEPAVVICSILIPLFFVVTRLITNQWPSEDFAPLLFCSLICIWGWVLLYRNADVIKT